MQKWLVLVFMLPMILPQVGIAADRVDLQVVPVPLEQVRLLPGPFKAAQDADAKYMLSLDPDRLLHVFRVNAGLASTAQPLGGWEKPDCELRGHFVGHYLSACALMYDSTGDERFKQRADYLVAELAKCQQALGGEYLSAFPDSFFDWVEARQKVWAPYYTIHKILAGLIEVNQHCGNAQALEVANGMARYFKKRIDKLSDEQMQQVMRTEFGGMMEALANLYAITGDADQLTLAKRFDHRSVFDPLSRGEDKLAGLHANTQIPKMTGAIRVFELTGEERYRKIAGTFWNAVVDHHSFITGGNSFGEHFKAPDIEATALWPTTAETCNTYNMLKLTRQMFALDPQARYIDYYERALLNHILGSIDPQSGGMLYFLSLAPGHFKVYNTPTDSFWCCTGTGIENHAKYGDTIYWQSGETLWVNLFIASEMKWPQKDVSVRQETKFPEDQQTTLTIHARQPARFALKLRIPSWASNATISINGALQAITTQPGSYAQIDCTWNDGDRIELKLPMALHLYHPKDAPDRVVVMDGPTVLAAELGKDQMPESDEAPDQNHYNKVPAPPVPELLKPINDATGVKPVEDKPLTFTTSGIVTPHDEQMVPLYQVHHQRYTVYWSVASH